MTIIYVFILNQFYNSLNLFHYSIFFSFYSMANYEFIYFFYIQTNELYFISIDSLYIQYWNFLVDFLLQQNLSSKRYFSLFFLVVFYVAQYSTDSCFLRFHKLKPNCSFCIYALRIGIFQYTVFLWSYVLVWLIRFLNVVLLGLKILHARKIK